MGVESILVGGTELNLPASDRKIYGQPINRRSGGMHVIQCLFKVWGTDNNDLNTKWNTVKAAFNKHDVACTIKYDSAAGASMESIGMGGSAGTKRYYTSITCTVEQVEEQASNESMMAMLTIAASYEEEETLNGQVGPILVETTINEAGFKQRTLTATFMQTGATALANYNSSKATLLGSSYLDVGSGGVVGGSDNMALVEDGFETADAPQRVFVTLIASEDINIFTQVGQRKVTELEVTSEDVPEWFNHSGAEDRPKMVSASGFITVDQRNFSGDLMGIFDSVKDTIKQRAQTETGASDMELVSVRLGVSYARSSITFDAAYLADNTRVFEFRIDEVQTERPMYFEGGPDADGYSTIQRQPGINEIILTRTVTRKGIGRVEIQVEMDDLDGIEAPGVKGPDYRWLGVDDDFHQYGPESNKWSDDVYTQVWRLTFRAFKFRSGQAIDTLKIGS